MKSEFQRTLNHIRCQRSLYLYILHPNTLSNRLGVRLNHIFYFYYEQVLH
ncbi:hypothetical protein Hanom_Chr08g00687261 [Helianthus anomalus]